jgi:hypothetical protein
VPTWLLGTLSVIGAVFGAMALALRLWENYRRPKIRLEAPPPGTDGGLIVDVVNQSLMPLQVREMGYEFDDVHRERFAVHRFDEARSSKPAERLFPDTYSMGTLLPPRSACYVTRPIAGIAMVAEMFPLAGVIALRGYCVLGNGSVLRTRSRRLSLETRTIVATRRDRVVRRLLFWRD